MLTEPRRECEKGAVNALLQWVVQVDSELPLTDDPQILKELREKHEALIRVLSTLRSLTNRPRPREPESVSE